MSSQSGSPPEFLLSVFPSDAERFHGARPFITLTYAQSLDGCIAGVGGRQLILSGNESMVMTHWLRTMHDGIMIGIGTALNDDPQLNARHLPPGHQHSLPRPIILDSQLRLSPSCKLLKNYSQGNGRRPWVVCNEVTTSQKQQRREELEKAGARILEVPANNDYLALDALFATLRTNGIRSLMVEGGQRVIGSVLCHLDSNSKTVVDSLIVTVAPVLVGEAGIRVLPEGLEKIPLLKHVSSSQFGKDTVIACRVTNP